MSFPNNGSIPGVFILLVFASLLVTITGAQALSGLEFHFSSRLEALRGPAWEARDIEFRLDQHGGGKGMLHVMIGLLSFSEALPPLQHVSLECPSFVLEARRLRCEAGQLSFGASRDKAVLGQISFDYQRSEQALNLSVTDLNLAGGRVKVQGRTAGNTWDLQISSTALSAQPVFAMLASVLAGKVELETVQGSLDVKASFSGWGTTLHQAKFKVTTRRLDFADGVGYYAVEKTNLALEGGWQSQSSGGQFTANLKGTGGSVYLDPIFIEFAAREPVTVHLRGSLQGEHLTISSLRFRDPGVMRAEGALTLSLNREESVLQRADIIIGEAVFPAAYSAYIQPFGVNTILGKLQTSGRVDGRMVYSQRDLQILELDLADLQLEDAQGRFGIAGLTGQLSWGRDAEPRRSILRWSRGHANRLSIGSADLVLESRAGSFRLVGTRRIPLLDGAVVIERLAGEGLGTEDFRWRFSGLLMPISMEALSQALTWPSLAGKISGVIPEVRYANYRLEVGGALLLRIFEGDITVTNLRMDNPFGSVPKIFADLDVRDLDLLALTRTFDFGKIEGKLAGWVRHLRLENWEPTYFEAAFFSPEDDRSRRRISQRAVENISALSGVGVTQALSRGILGMFKEFRYKRLGVRCRLENGVCEINGVAPAGQGYYLVEGSGLPRIDVIGYNRRVDWHELLARLKAAARSEKPVVR